MSDNDLKSEFFRKFSTDSFRGYPLEQCHAIWKFFEPHLKITNKKSNMKIEYFLASENSDKAGTIPKKEFSSIESIRNEIFNTLCIRMASDPVPVYLVSVHSISDEVNNHGDSDILVTDKLELVYEFLDLSITLNCKDGAGLMLPDTLLHFFVHVQIYYSYEEAYKVALDMKEVNELCYNKPKKK